MHHRLQFHASQPAIPCITGGRDDLWLHAESGDDGVGASSLRALYVAAGADPFELLRRGFAEVAAATGSFAPLSSKVEAYTRTYMT